jgi:hypothetical protein
MRRGIYRASAAILGDPGNERRRGVPGGDGSSAQPGDKPRDGGGLGCYPKLLPVVFVYIHIIILRISI